MSVISRWVQQGAEDVQTALLGLILSGRHYLLTGSHVVHVLRM